MYNSFKEHRCRWPTQSALKVHHLQLSGPFSCKLWDGENQSNRRWSHWILLYFVFNSIWSGCMDKDELRKRNAWWMYIVYIMHELCILWYENKYEALGLKMKQGKMVNTFIWRCVIWTLGVFFHIFFHSALRIYTIIIINVYLCMSFE